MKSFEQQYPHVASWVQDGWIEIGRTGYDATFIRVLDEGGMIWSSEDDSDTIDHALVAADAAIRAWCLIHMPDLIIGHHNSAPFTQEEGQYLAFVYNYTQIMGQFPAESDIQNYFHVDRSDVQQMLTELEKSGLISRTSGQAHSIRTLVPPQMLPALM